MSLLITVIHNVQRTTYVMCTRRFERLVPTRRTRKRKKLHSCVQELRIPQCSHSGPLLLLYCLLFHGPSAVTSLPSLPLLRLRVPVGVGASIRRPVIEVETPHPLSTCQRLALSIHCWCRFPNNQGHEGHARPKQCQRSGSLRMRAHSQRFATLSLIFLAKFTF